MDYKKQVAQSIVSALDGQLEEQVVYEKVEVPKTSKMGDFAFPAFILAKTLHKAPQMIAADLVKNINQENYEKVEAAGPYVNFFLDKSKFSLETLQTVLTEKDHFGDATVGNNGKVPIDMSSPNIAKPISMGHLRSTVIGNALANLLAKTGVGVP